MISDLPTTYLINLFQELAREKHLSLFWCFSWFTKRRTIIANSCFADIVDTTSAASGGPASLCWFPSLARSSKVKCQTRHLNQFVSMAIKCKKAARILFFCLDDVDATDSVSKPQYAECTDPFSLLVQVLCSFRYEHVQCECIVHCVFAFHFSRLFASDAGKWTEKLRCDFKGKVPRLLGTITYCPS